MVLRSCLCGLFASKKRTSQTQPKLPLSKELKLQPIVSTPTVPVVPQASAADPKEIEKIRELCPRFRILIIGRANSGKTTIIQKVCDTNDAPVHHDPEGNEIDPSKLKGPDAKRGIHNIRLEITYASNPNFVFHDSMGFEAGSVDELEAVREFIKEKLAQSELRNRLHAIWYCVPMDSPRVASEAELSFFKENTGDIPVILLFTKWDGQIRVAYNALRQREGMGRLPAEQEAPSRAQQTLDDEFIPVFMRTPHPPASYTILESMHKPETRCAELIEKTEAALDNSVLKKLFVRVQTHNLRLCVKGAINESISRDIFSQADASLKHNIVVATVLSWFPHIFVILLRLSLEWDQARDYSAFQYESLFLTPDDEKQASDRYLILVSPAALILICNFCELLFPIIADRKISKSPIPPLAPLFVPSPNFNTLSRFQEEAEILQMFEPTVSSSKEAFPSLYLQLFDIAVAAAVVATHSFNVRHSAKTVQDAIKPSIDAYLTSKHKSVVKNAIKEQLRQHVESMTTDVPEEDLQKAMSEVLLKICLDNLMN